MFEQRLCEDEFGVAVQKINQNGKSVLRCVRCVPLFPLQSLHSDALPLSTNASANHAQQSNLRSAASLFAESGASPSVVVEEKVDGFLSYTGTYSADLAGAYSLAVLQLECCGLSGKYYDNQWLMDLPVIERLDSMLNFDLGSGAITPYGRDYVSIRWWGKLKPDTNELYTFYVAADDGVRLYINHILLVDSWEDNPNKKRAQMQLTANSYHDIKIEYKKETGPAYFQLQWSSRSIRKHVIPSSNLYYPTHILGSPFPTIIMPGGTDYPHSDFVPVSGRDRTRATAGEQAFFLIQAKDLIGNIKTSNGDSQGDYQSPQQQFTVDIIGSHGTTSGSVAYIGSGQYRVNYTLTKAGMYTVHAKTGGTDIYCGLGEENRCSPFSLTVVPGPTVGSMCEAESESSVDSLVKARAGENGVIYVQAKDAYGNNRHIGGDNLIVKFSSTDNPNIQYRGNIADQSNGTYVISYSIPLSGSYIVSISLDGESVQYCRGPSGDRWHNRNYDGVNVYYSPAFCSFQNDTPLHVVHHKLHALSSTVIDNGKTGLAAATVGVENGFAIQARDKFGNIRSGSGTPHIPSFGDGSSDTFLVTLVGPGGYSVRKSSYVNIIVCLNSAIPGYFRLIFGDVASHDLPHDISPAAMEIALMTMHGISISTEVNRKTINGNHEWAVTFLSHFEEWSKHSLSVIPSSDGIVLVSDQMSVLQIGNGGLYPIAYTVWKKGIYELSITSSGSIVSDSTYTIEVADGAVQASSSNAFGQGLISGSAGEKAYFEIQTKDVQQSEVQVIQASGVVINYVNEVQTITIPTALGDYFLLTFRGKTTTGIQVGTSLLVDLKTALEELATINHVSVHSSGSETINSGDQIDVEFHSKHGDLDLMMSSNSDIITKKL